MFEIRVARLSLHSDLSDIFTSGSVLSQVFNVYGEEELRDETHSSVRPFIFITDAWIMFKTKHLPLIVIETDYDKGEFELGNQAQGRCLANLHIFGRNRGERDDLAGAIMQGLTAVHIRDFDTDGYPIVNTQPLLETAGRTWTCRNMTVSSEMAFEGTLLNWLMLSCSFWAF